MGNMSIWEPTINSDRCNGCRICLEFCPQQVYSADVTGRITVQNGENCVDGCHGCEWQCPQWAITFPEPMTAAYLEAAAAYCSRTGKTLPRPMLDYAKARYGLNGPLVSEVSAGPPLTYSVISSPDSGKSPAPGGGFEEPKRGIR